MKLTDEQRADICVEWSRLQNRDLVGLCKMVEAELAKQAPGWISVEERLPEDRQAVAFVVSCKNQDWDYLDGIVLGGVFKAETYSGGFSVPGLTVKASHWMPLPAPPAAQRGEEGNK